MRRFGVKTFQAEDEIAAVGVAIGASFGGAIGVTGTSGPGICLKSRGDRPGGDDRAAAGHHRRAARRPEHRPADQDRAGRPAAGDVRPQRRVPGGDRRPAVARPTASTWPSRRSGSPRGSCARSSSCPTATSPTGPSRGRSRTSTKLPKIEITHPTEPNSDGWTGAGHENGERRAAASSCRTSATSLLVRPWAIPGTPGLEHRIGGIEKQDVTGNVNYEPANHEHMVRHPGAEDREHRPDDPRERYVAMFTVACLVPLRVAGDAHGAVPPMAHRHGVRVLLRVPGRRDNQYYPALYEGIAPVEPDKTPEEGYLNDDLTAHTVKWIRRRGRH